MKALYLDCASGISGNMFLGACIQLGVPEKYLRQELDKLKLSNEYVLEISDAIKNGIGAAYANVVFHHDHIHEFEPEKILHEHNGIHHHAAHHHAHRTMADIRKIINESALSDGVKNTALKIFGVIAEAEGKVHNKPADEVHFHEVGAVDSIVDIVGCAVCVDYLDVEKIFVGRINVGSGFVKCAHGLMMVPAPATAELLQNFKTYSYEIGKELTTPTGAALLKALAIPVEEVPSGFTGERIGYGAGTRDVSIPNVLRVNVGELSCKEEKSETLCVLECNLDDMNPQILPYALEKLLDAGARDAWLQPIVMKKGRPAQLLKVLCAPEQQDAMQRILFTETTTLGVRAYTVQRTALERRWRNAQTPWGTVRIKEGLSDGVVVNAVPEFEDCKRLAKETGQALKVIEAEALRCKQVK